MKTHRVLCECTSENAGNPGTVLGPVTRVENDMVFIAGADDEEKSFSLLEERACCRAPDDDALTTEHRYYLADLTLPDWLSVDSWSADRVDWRWLWGLGADKEWPETWQRSLLKLGYTSERLGCIKLLQCDPARQRSEFRIDLRKQLIQWLETNPETRKFNSPFSLKQWEYVCTGYIAMSARRLETALYHRRQDPPLEIQASRAVPVPSTALS